MAIIKCPECGGNVSDQAENCVHCGYPLSKRKPSPVNSPVAESVVSSGEKEAESVKGKRNWKLPGIISVVLVAVVVAVVLLVTGKKPIQVTVGQSITLGHYPQTTAGDDQTPIEWIVLDYDEANHKVLLLSKCGLDAVRYNKTYIGITWGNCTLRAWLNGEFLNKAFSAKEQSAILVTDVDNSSDQGYSGWSTDGGNNTQDRIFLLSYAEANSYLGVKYWEDDDSINTKSRVVPTAYAIAQGAWATDSKQSADGEPAAVWWLRSPGGGQYCAAIVDVGGALYYDSVNEDYNVVRPALWVNLESDIF